jgi:glutamate decarboxylase
MIKHFKDSAEQEFTTSIYGSRVMAQPLPKYRLPEGSLPGATAYQLVHDQLNLDMKPDKNLASFVTTWMEPEADRLMQESMRFNLANEDEYPHVIGLEERCVNMLARLFHADPKQAALGVATIGSSEAVMLGGLAMKWRWRLRRQQAGLPADRPNLVMGENVQVVWEKFCRYFDVEPRCIPVEPGRYITRAEDVTRAVDENTIGVCAILGTTFTGEFEPVAEISDALDRIQADRGWDIPIHVDAASGGFVAPFLYPHLKWDFRLPRVCSINVSGHKYGLVYPGLGWVIWRDKTALPEELVFHVNYLGGEMPTFTLNFSRPASPIVAQYYNFLRLGREGYTNIMLNLKAVADYLAEQLAATGVCRVIGSRQALPLVAFAVEPDAGFTVFQLSDKLREYGWFAPAYTMPKNATEVAVMRIVVRENLSRELAGDLMDDFKRAVAALQKGENHNHNHAARAKRKSKHPC